ncbi:unnamed protein product [Rotaria magnacalcarata]|uniref:ubiquitinyl hydrolase 1 n=6 Tax=Rotaria magnacalcarata TaxID=392030 RepID=A0A815P2Z4_9BILA|nr:unnamed protein product [Rotaria magnacalcarata]CAF1443446.1 unnamed protein product [Rotaria magnacalcarata]
MDKVTARTGIYHEHQQSALCGQHALNNLLQSSVFSVDSLAEMAKHLDQEERNVLTSSQYDVSKNMNDTGFFSIQVLHQALKTVSLELVSFASQEDIAKQARARPHSIKAYICNLGLHWFTIRRFGSSYFNLNSFYYVPELITNSYLVQYINFIQENGYSVFIVHGDLQNCTADLQLTTNPISPHEYRLLIKDLPKLIMDDKIIENMSDLNNHMNEKITVPQHVYNEYKKNPNDPQIRQKLLQYVPKYIADQLVPTNVDPSHPQHNRAHRVLIMAVQQKSDTALSMIPQCDCPRHRHNSSVLLTDHVPQFMNDDDWIDDPSESSVITEYRTQCIVNNPGLINSNEREQQVMLFSSEPTFVHQSSNKNDSFTDNRVAQQIIQSLTEFDTKKNNLTPYTTTKKSSDSPKKSPSINSPFYKDPIEEWNQQQMKAAIAASLITNNPTTTTTKAEETSERTVTTNVSASSAMKIEEIPLLNSENVAAVDLGHTPPMNPPPITASDSERISMANLGGTPPTNSTRTPTLKLSTKSLNAEMPTTTNLSPPTITNHDVIMSLFHTDRLFRNRVRCFISRQSGIPIEKLSLYACLYHIRPYCSSSTSTLINEICLRRLLKSNYSCEFQESQQTSEHKLLPNKSTFILGHYMITLQLNHLRLYIIDKNNLIFIAEDLFPVKIVFIGICTYTNFQNRNFVKQDGFILMTADQRLFLYDFKLKLRMPSNGISFQCEMPVKFLEKSFEYHEAYHMISIHTRYKQRSHLFILLRIWPRWLSYIFLIEPQIFGSDLKQAAITHEFLIVQNQRNSCNLYSLHNILDEYTVKSHSIDEHPGDSLPINVIITSCPTALYTFNGERPLFDYAFCSTQHYLTRINEDYFVFHLNNDSSPISNGHLKRSWTDNLSPNSQVYFIDTKNNHDCIIDIRESTVYVWHLIPDESTSIKHLYTIDDGTAAIPTSSDRQMTRYGRQTKPQNVLDLSSAILTDHCFDRYNNLLTLLFESESSNTAIIRIIEHPIGICCQDIHFTKNNKNNQLKIMHEHDKLIVQELSCHTVILRLFTLERSR